MYIHKMKQTERFCAEKKTGHQCDGDGGSLLLRGGGLSTNQCKRKTPWEFNNKDK